MLRHRVLSRLAGVDAVLGDLGFSARLADRLFMDGECREAQVLMERHAIRFLERRGATPSPDRIRVELRRPTFSAEEKRACLRDVYASLPPHGIRPFLAFGTLLGRVRENGFIPYDRDIDIGIFLSLTSVDTVRDVLGRSGFRLAHYRGPDWPCRVNVRHKTGVSVDVAFFKEADGALLTHMYWLGVYVERRRERFDLRRDEFLGIDVWVPAHPERFLRENYGAWETPSSLHHPILTSQLTDFRTPLVRYESARFFYRLLTRGRVDHARAFVALARARYRGDPYEAHWRHVGALLEPGHEDRRDEAGASRAQSPLVSSGVSDVLPGRWPSAPNQGDLAGAGYVPTIAAGTTGDRYE